MFERTSICPYGIDGTDSGYEVHPAPLIRVVLWSTLIDTIVNNIYTGILWHATVVMMKVHQR